MIYLREALIKMTNEAKKDFNKPSSAKRNLQRELKLDDLQEFEEVSEETDLVK